MSLLATLTTGTPIFRVRVADVDATGRLRPVDEAHAQLIAASMNETRQIQAIVVRVHPSGSGWKLVVGGHRHRAGQINEWAELDAIAIECSDDEARQIEIDENLARKELTALERAQFLAERKRIYETLHPETGHGKAKKPRNISDKAKVANFATFSRFSVDAAKAANLSERSVQLAVEIFSGLVPEVLPLIRGSVISRKQAALQVLADLPADQQMAIGRAVAERPGLTIAAARFAAGLAPQGGAVRQADQLLTRLEALLGRQWSLDQLRDAQAMVGAKIAAAEAAQKPVRATKGGAA